MGSPRWFQSGETFFLDSSHPSVLRVCVAGDIRAQCLGGADGIPMRSEGCEVLDSDCTCYRWMFNSQNSVQQRGPGGSTAKIYPHPLRKNCASIIYSPQALDTTQIKINFHLDRFRKVVPPSTLYGLYHLYTLRRKYQKNFKKSFFGFVYSESDEICGKKNKDPIAITYACSKSLNMNIIPVSTPRMGVHTHIVVPLITGGVIAIVLGKRLF